MHRLLPALQPPWRAVPAPTSRASHRQGLAAAGGPRPETMQSSRTSARRSESSRPRWRKPVAPWAGGGSFTTASSSGCSRCSSCRLRRPSTRGWPSAYPMCRGRSWQSTCSGGRRTRGGRPRSAGSWPAGASAARSLTARLQRQRKGGALGAWRSSGRRRSARGVRPRGNGSRSPSGRGSVQRKRKSWPLSSVRQLRSGSAWSGSRRGAGSSSRRRRSRPTARSARPRRWHGTAAWSGPARQDGARSRRRIGSASPSGTWRFSGGSCRPIHPSTRTAGCPRPRPRAGSGATWRAGSTAARSPP
mmetsp:Transcript_29552/g.92216  ORF Transcript_29552/g.92216 Transcript_29552/m.92216 type:complete len:303 (-) Transcript_29552:177-1085(-)